MAELKGLIVLPAVLGIEAFSTGSSVAELKVTAIATKFAEALNVLHGIIRGRIEGAA